MNDRQRFGPRPVYELRLWRRRGQKMGIFFSCVMVTKIRPSNANNLPLGQFESYDMGCVCGGNYQFSRLDVIYGYGIRMSDTQRSAIIWAD